jgi:hypothetical protein
MKALKVIAVALVATFACTVANAQTHRHHRVHHRHHHVVHRHHKM